MKGNAKQSIHISSKMEFLEHEKEKAIASFKNRWKLAWRLGEAGIPTNSKFNTSCADSNLGLRARVAAHQRVCLDWDLASRLDHVEGSNRKSAVAGGRRNAVASHFGDSNE
ncbi:hypothetical protein AVEN_183283-1 [Araneus ventricosus]|uniref:Uncharacterized protein n=1 Tax=Araneus ventricosus TaxID=182803 RepID=A0A4Y2EV47_ARAVE|nr:hypothetical protein AVEN_183283-1 [Araneus ventricosus]